MIIKERKKPLRLSKLDVLLHRLKKSHSIYPNIEHEYAKKIAGYKDEKSIDYFLSYLKEDYCIFNNIRLLDKKHFFQMDTVIVSASFMCNLEVKNIAGTLFFDEANDQMIRTFDGKEEGFPNSLIQIRRQQKHLQNWLADHHFPCLPCYSFVIISNSSTIIKSTKSLKTHVIHSATIPFKFYLLENNNKEQILTKSSLKKLSKTLLKEHREDDCNILEQFNITREDMITGVQCQSCGYIPMNRSNGFWRCSSCKHKSKDAHIQTLDDYKYLFGKEISNQQLRSFLQISSRTSAAKLLRKLTYCHEGTTKNRVYFIPFLTGSKTPTPRLERN